MKTNLLIVVALLVVGLSTTASAGCGFFSAPEQPCMQEWPGFYKRMVDPPTHRRRQRMCSLDW
jgi:hypothetical protein